MRKRLVKLDITILQINYRCGSRASPSEHIAQSDMRKNSLYMLCLICRLRVCTYSRRRRQVTFYLKPRMHSAQSLFQHPCALLIQFELECIREEIKSLCVCLLCMPQLHGRFSLVRRTRRSVRCVAASLSRLLAND